MSITYYGIEWDYNNLAGITYNSATLNEPYATWLYQITAVTEKETENAFSLAYSSEDKGVSKHYKDNVRFTEDESRNYLKDSEEAINLDIVDSYNRNATNNKKEDLISLSVSTDRFADRDVSERLLKFSDYRNSIASKVYNESLSISDSYAQGVISKDDESITISDDLPARSIHSFIKESKVYFLDEGRFIATDEQGDQTIGEQTEVDGGVVLFDFEINSTPLSESNFENWIEENSPINYNELRPFIPGEYEYKDAYVGFKLSIPPTEGRFGVYGSTVYIDVEDTVEKGFAEATSDGLTRVTFSKRFYTSPHIMSSLVYATENCYVEIPTVTKEYFEFGLKSISSGLYLNGEISWLADGY